MLALTVLAVALAAVPASAGTNAATTPASAETDAVYKTIADDLSAFFSWGQARVISASGPDVVLDDAAKFPAGMRLSVLRPGSVFKHPVTGAPYATSEMEVGTVEPLKADEAGTVRARVLTGTPAAGDIVRASSSRTKLLVFSDELVQSQVADGVVKALSASGRFDVEDGGIIGLGVSVPEAGRGLSTATLHLKKSGEVLSGEIFPAGSSLPTMKKFSWPYPAIAQVVESKPKPESAAVDFAWRHYKVPYRATAAASGDMDGNGREEILIGGGSLIHIYSIEKYDLASINEIDAGRVSGSIIALGAADINRNGRAEILATFLSEGASGLLLPDNPAASVTANNSVVTIIYEFDPVKGFRELTRFAGWGGRVSPDGAYLQRFSNETGFAGPLMRLEADGALYSMKTGPGLPAGVDIYGFIGSGSAGIMFTPDGRLRSSDGLWTSVETFGGGEPSVMLSSGLGEAPKSMILRVPPTADRNSQGRFWAFKNNPLTGLMPGIGFRSSDMTCFASENGTVKEIRRISDIAGVANDLISLADGTLGLLLSPPSGGSQLFSSWRLFNEESVFMVIDPWKR
ncbi:MAG: VCBS repeat-containing protein [Nitrospirae bacterium]|nr:VCBS repeat-containing protein [Nitrospirota bacterium]